MRHCGARPAPGRSARVALALVLALGCSRATEEPGEPEAPAPDEAGDVEAPEPPTSEGARLFAEALELESTNLDAAQETYVRITLDHADELDCGEAAGNQRCADAARARIDVLSCRKARGKEPTSATVEEFTAHLAQALAAPGDERLVALADCDFWFGACASDAGSADAAGNVVPALADRLRASAGVELVEGTDEASRLATRPDARGRILELTLVRREAGWVWEAACESEPPSDGGP